MIVVASRLTPPASRPPSYQPVAPYAYLVVRISYLVSRWVPDALHEGRFTLGPYPLALRLTFLAPHSLLLTLYCSPLTPPVRTPSPRALGSE